MFMILLLLRILTPFEFISDVHAQCTKEVTRDNNQTFTWTYATDSNYLSSEPPCFFKNGSILTRRCLDGQWTPQKNSFKCEFDYNRENHICPKDFFEIPREMAPTNPFCVKISKEVVNVKYHSHRCFNSKTTYHNLTQGERDVLLNHIFNLNQSYWSSRRANKEIFAKEPKRNSNDDEATLRGVCLFEASSLPIQSLCPNNYRTMLNDQKMCYGIKDYEGLNKYEQWLSIEDYFRNRNAIRLITNTVVPSNQYFFLKSLLIDGKRYSLQMNNQEKFKIQNYFPNNSVKYLGMEVIPPKKYTFASFFDIPCQESPSTNEETEKCAKRHIIGTLRDELNCENVIVHSVKIMNNASMGHNFKKISALWHISASLENDEGSFIDEDDGHNTGVGNHHTTVHMKIRGYLSDLIKLLTKANSSSVNSTECCLPELVFGNLNLFWPRAVLGETSVTSRPCLQNNLPITRRCIGDSLFGAMWENMGSNELSCEQNLRPEPELITDRLHEISISKRPIEDPKNTLGIVKEIIQSAHNNLIAADIFSLGRIMVAASAGVIAMKSTPKARHNLTKNMFNDIMSICNNVMEMDEDVLHSSSKLNSTNILLDGFDRLVDELSNMSMSLNLTTTDDMTKDDVVREESDDRDGIVTRYYNGAVAWVAPKLSVFRIDSSVSNVTGLAFYKTKNDSREGFTNNSSYRFLLSNQSVEELLEEDDLELASYVPERLCTLYNLQDIEIIIKKFENNALFQENRDIMNNNLYSNILSISIAGHDLRNLAQVIPLLTRKPSDSKGKIEEACRYWNTSYNTWSREGIEFLGTSKKDGNLIWCGTRHLTSFANIMGKTKLSDTNRRALNIITLAGCCVSLIGTTGIFLTALTFRKWREKDSAKIILQISLANALQMVLLCFVNTEYTVAFLVAHKLNWGCVALGACLQYSMIAQFSWTMIVAYLQFKKFVIVFGNTLPEMFYLKSFIIGWILPLLPVILVIWLDAKPYIPSKKPYSSLICYPTGLSLYLGIYLPVAMFVFCNIIIYVAVLKHIYAMPKGVSRQQDHQLLLSKIRVSVFLFFLLGITWIFGLLTAVESGVIFSYLFTITASIHGFVIFVNNIILDPVTRTLWTGCFVKRARHEL